MLKKINLALHDEAFYSACILVVVSLASFGLGRQSVVGQGSMETMGTVTSTTVRPASFAPEQMTETVLVTGTSTVQYVASKNGTKYHLPWCSGAQRISEENKVWFTSKEDAEAAGYSPAANCKGI